MPDSKSNNMSNSLMHISNEDLFLKLSRVLTGVDKLDNDIAEEYYHQYLQQKFGIYLDELLGVYREVAAQPKPLEALLERIKNDPLVLHVAKQIVRIWYISQFFPDYPDSPTTPAPVIKPQVYAGHWKNGILWDIIRAHPPAYSDQHHGYWADPPEGH